LTGYEPWQRQASSCIVVWTPEAKSRFAREALVRALGSSRGHLSRYKGVHFVDGNLFFDETEANLQSVSRHPPTPCSDCKIRFKQLVTPPDGVHVHLQEEPATPLSIVIRATPPSIRPNLQPGQVIQVFGRSARRRFSRDQYGHRKMREMCPVPWCTQWIVHARVLP
jgi:hypothetical protein